MLVGLCLFDYKYRMIEDPEWQAPEEDIFPTKCVTRLSYQLLSTYQLPFTADMCEYNHIFFDN
jgi:hypothetical protein